MASADPTKIIITRKSYKTNTLEVFVPPVADIGKFVALHREELRRKLEDMGLSRLVVHPQSGASRETADQVQEALERELGDLLNTFPEGDPEFETGAEMCGTAFTDVLAKREDEISSRYKNTVHLLLAIMTNTGKKAQRAKESVPGAFALEQFTPVRMDPYLIRRESYEYANGDHVSENIIGSDDFDPKEYTRVPPEVFDVLLRRLVAGVMIKEYDGDLDNMLGVDMEVVQSQIDSTITLILQAVENLRENVIGKKGLFANETAMQNHLQSVESKDDPLEIKYDPNQEQAKQQTGKEEQKDAEKGDSMLDFLSESGTDYFTDKLLPKGALGSMAQTLIKNKLKRKKT